MARWKDEEENLTRTKDKETELGSFTNKPGNTYFMV